MQIKVWKLSLMFVIIFALSAISNVHAATLTGTITVGNAPWGIAYDSAKGEIFVANTGFNVHSTNNTVSVISDRNNTVIATIHLPANPYNIVYDPRIGKLFVTTDTSRIYVIADSNNTVVANVSVGIIPSDEAYDSAKGEIFVVDGDLSKVSVISDRNNTVVATLTIPETVSGGSGPDPRGLTYDSVKGEIFVMDWNDNMITVISDSNNTVVAKIDMPSNARAPIYAAYDPAKREIFVTCTGHMVYVISDRNNTIVANVDLNPYQVYPEGITYDSAKGEMFLADTVTNNVTAIYDSNNTVASNLGLPTVNNSASPMFLAYDSAKGEVFVTNNYLGTVSVISDSYSSSSIPKPTQTTGSLIVNVKDSSGGVLSGVAVSSTNQPSGQARLYGTTGSDGLVTFSNVATGAYALQASKSGYVTGGGTGSVAAGSSASVSIALQTQSSGGGGGGGGGVPGFPVEATVLGIILIVVVLSARKRLSA